MRPKIETKERIIRLNAEIRNNLRILPILKISGFWLKKAGFEAGDLVSVTAVNNKLIIKVSEKFTEYGNTKD